MSFTEWTDDGHIRHPSFEGLRRGQEVTMETPVVITKSGQGKQKADRIDVLGVAVSHPDRVIFRDVGVSKADLAEFYAAATSWILKDISGHSVSLLRCPEGTAGDCFYQRNPGTSLGPDAKPFRWKHKGKSKWVQSSCIRGGVCRKLTCQR